MRSETSWSQTAPQPQSGERMHPRAHAVGQREEIIKPRRGERPGLSITGGLAIFCVLVVIPAAAHAQVTFDRLLNSAKEPQNWMTYSGDYAGKRFSALDQINITNARTIVAKWV